MSISEAMSKEYQRRYGYEFIPFHNPIDIEFWRNYQKNNYELNESPTILYAGRIGIGIQESLKEIAQAVETVNEKLGTNIKFVMKTNEKPVWSLQFSCVDIQEMEPHNKMPQLFSNADILILSFDFSEESIRFTKYSMPTKASEYMASGTPILLYASSEVGVTKHALNYQWAYVVPEKNNEKLEKALIDIYQTKQLRVKLGTNAKQFAETNYDGNKVRTRFRNAFTLT
jgi:glycosyltransferase involved in cell wall biosynthesis